MGIDPGTNFMGYAIIKVFGKNQKPELVVSGIVDMIKITDPYIKLQRIFSRIMVGRIKLSAPKIRRQTSPHPSPISTLGRFFDSIHCSTMITTNNAVIAKSIPVVSIGSTDPSSAPIAEPMIQ